MAVNTGVVPAFLLLGDSLTQYSFSSDGGWASILADKLQRKCDFISRGLSGYNTRMYLHYLKAIMDPFHKQQSAGAANVCGVIIFLGANDAADSSLNSHQHIPLLEYEDNLVAIVNDVFKFLPHLKSQSDQPGEVCDRIIIVSPPPVDEEVRHLYCVSTDRILDRFNHVTECYAKACQSAAERAGVSFVDFFGEAVSSGAGRKLSSDEPVSPGNNNFFTDGLHLGVNGAAKLASVLWPNVNKITRRFPIFLPEWRDVHLE